MRVEFSAELQQPPLKCEQHWLRSSASCPGTAVWYTSPGGRSVGHRIDPQVETILLGASEQHVTEASKGLMDVAQHLWPDAQHT